MPETNTHLKKSIVALLLRLQKADTDKTIREFAYIHKVASHLGLSAEDVIGIERDLSSYPLKPPSDEKERMTILYYLLFLMDIDGNVKQEEEDLVKEFGLRLGFRMGLTTELINEVKRHATTRIPPDALIEHIRKYLN
ncbi:MAG TPA: hypothetical protein VI603_00755 [Saprospiraceae bacterium]|nr:hypothetical protein [Saprospiraceae bacterium]